MLRFTAMSCQREAYTEAIEGFASINVTVNDFGAMSISVSCYDSYQSSFSKMLSKLPVIRDFSSITDYQNRMRIALDNIKEGGELIVGFYRHDITLFNQLIRELRKTKFNGGKLFIDINRPVRQLVDEVSENKKVTSSYDIADYFGIDMTLVKELACITFDVDYYAELPQCATRAALYCCVKMQEEGYDLEDVLSCFTEYMRAIEEAKYESDVVVNISKRGVAATI